jgi:hypothetical protein
MHNSSKRGESDSLALKWAIGYAGKGESSVKKALLLGWKPFDRFFGWFGRCEDAHFSFALFPRLNFFFCLFCRFFNA